MPSPNSYNAAAKLFTAEFVKTLFPSNDFLSYSRDWSAYANAGVVNYTESAGSAGYIINRTGILTPVEQDDLNNSYDLDEFQTIPSLLRWVNELTVNYQKRQEIIANHTGSIREGLSRRILFRWCPKPTDGGKLFGSSGAARPATLGTGTRATITFDDVVRLSAALDADDVPDDGRRILVIPASFKADMLKIPQFTNLQYVPNSVAIPNGTIGMVLGFLVVVRSRTIFGINLNADINTANPTLPRADNIATEPAVDARSCEIALAYHPEFTTRSVSSDSLTSIIQAHGGVELSMTALAGGRSLYRNYRGVVGLAEKFIS